MIIPINLPSSSSSNSTEKLPPQLARLGSDEVVLIELQGALEVEGDNAGQFVGKLQVGDNDSVKPTLKIGHHLLEGKIINLSKPLAVIAKRKSQPESPRSVHMDSTQDDVDGIKASADITADVVSWDIVAVVKRKLLFSKRPVPIIAMTKAEGDKSTGGATAAANGKRKR